MFVNACSFMGSLIEMEVRTFSNQGSVWFDYPSGFLPHVFKYYGVTFRFITFCAIFMHKSLTEGSSTVFSVGVDAARYKAFKL